MGRCLTTQVLVVGAGPAGIATALGLKDLGINVTIVDLESPETNKFGEHLTPDAVPYLERLNILDSVKKCQHLRCTGIKSAWGSKNLLNQDYLFNPYGNGFNLSRGSFDAALLEEADRRGIQIFLNTRISNPINSNDRWVVKLMQKTDNLTLQNDFLVDATGRRAWLARKRQCKLIIHDQLIGVIGFVEHKPSGCSASNRILLEACEDGWWYSTPLPGGKIVAAYMTDADLYRKQNQPAQVFWSQCLKASVFTKDRLSGAQQSVKVHVRPAWSQILSNLVGSRWVAVGDAAMSYDPLSSQGISKGLQWGIAESVRKRLEGDRYILQIYQQEIQETFRQYLKTQRQYYQMETRWSSAKFWRRRH